MAAYYNEIDPYAAAWLRNLITAGHIAPGEVDERSIADVVPTELAGFTQCHFFAGIGVWSYALRLAGWPDDRPVWTGSCPCQPFSAAGRGEGFADERHLWPALYHHIGQRRPAIFFGEQVASKAVDAWIDLVQDDLEALGYAVGAIPFPSAGVGAPHIRDRAFFRADANRRGLDGWSAPSISKAGGVAGTDDYRADGGLADLHFDGCDQGWGSFASAGDDGSFGDGPTSGMADSDGLGRARPPGIQGQRRSEAGTDGHSAVGILGIAAVTRSQGVKDRRGYVLGPGGAPPERASGEFAGRMGHNRGPLPTDGFWADPDWLFCRDEKWRPVEPGTSPLAHGAPARVGRLRAYGNAINAEAAAAFIRAYLDI